MTTQGLSLEEGDWGRSISLKDAFLAKQQMPQQQQPQPGLGNKSERCIHSCASSSC